MPPEAIETAPEVISRVPAQRVWTSPSLKYKEWTERPYLYVDDLAIACAPNMDECKLTYHYGEIIREDVLARLFYEPQEIVGQFIKVELYDRETEEVAVRWYGVIEFDEKELHGSSDGNPRGIQKFTAYSLLHLLDRVFFKSSILADEEEETEITLARGLPFNLKETDKFEGFGNRSAAISTTTGTYVFNAESEVEGEEWKASQAVEYLLKNHAPIDATGGPALDAWTLEGGEDHLDWYQITLRTDGRTVKELLDELIPRKRAVGYFVTYDEDENTATVKTYSLPAADLELATGILKANPNQKTLDFENAQDVLFARLRNIRTETYDRIIVQGDFRTSTGTLRFDLQSEHIRKAWSDDEATGYLAAGTDSTDPDYGAMSRAEKMRFNALIRSSDQFGHVFARWQVDPAWNQRISDPDADNPQPEYFFSPYLSPLAGGEPDKEYVAGVVETSDKFWNQALILLPKLTLKSQYDYSADNIRDLIFDAVELQGEPQYLEPLIFIETGTDQANEPVFEQVEHLAMGSADERAPRHWAGKTRIDPQGGTIEIRAVGAPQHFLATADFGAAAADTEPMHSPGDHGGLNWTDLRATVTAKLDSRVEATVVVRTPAEGVPERVLYLELPEGTARLDYVVPKTVVAIRNGRRIVTDTGGFVRDDRFRCEAIADSAAKWYGDERQTLELAFKNIRPLVELGWLINEIGAPYNVEGVHTVVTRIVYSMDDPRSVSTRIETSFPEFDLA